MEVVTSSEPVTEADLYKQLVHKHSGTQSYQVGIEPGGPVRMDQNRGTSEDGIEPGGPVRMDQNRGTSEDGIEPGEPVRMEQNRGTSEERGLLQRC